MDGSIGQACYEQAKAFHDTISAQSHVYGLLSLPSGKATPIGSLVDLTHMRRGPDHMRGVLAAIASPDTRIISSTVTEKGSRRNPITGDLDLDAADLAVRVGAGSAFLRLLGR